MSDCTQEQTNSSVLLLPSLVCSQNDVVTAFKKARQQYFQRCDELEKAKAVSAKAVDDTAGLKTLDKRRKSKDEAQTKVNLLVINPYRSHVLYFAVVLLKVLISIRKCICGFKGTVHPKIKNTHFSSYI